MLQYSFSTVLMAVLSCNIIIIFTAVCFCHKSTLVSIGYKMFALLLGITLLRFVFPFQFPFTSNIALSHTLSQAIAYICHTLFRIGTLRVSIWTIFEFIWILGVLIKLAIFIKNQIVFHHWVVWYSRNVTNEDPYSRLLDEICGDRPNPFCVFELPGLKIPVLYGMRHPRILIPVDMEIPENELRCLLSHEIAHHYHHDILIKTGLNLLTIVYWWNPACYVLKAQLDAVLEMRIDRSVAGDTFDSQRSYLNCLIYVAESSIDRNTKGIRLPDNSIALLNSHHYNNLTNRFNIIGETPKPYSKLLHVMVFLLTMALYLLSYTFIFEARYTAPEGATSPVVSFDSGIYAILNDDNTYNIYYNGLLIETIDSLDQHPGEITLFNDISEVPPELRIYLK